MGGPDRDIQPQHWADSGIVVCRWRRAASGGMGAIRWLVGPAVLLSTGRVCTQSETANDRIQLSIQQQRRFSPDPPREFLRNGSVPVECATPEANSGSPLTMPDSCMPVDAAEEMWGALVH